LQIEANELCTCEFASQGIRGLRIARIQKFILSVENVNMMYQWPVTYDGLFLWWWAIPANKM
jgi:hypothetical protein